MIRVHPPTTCRSFAGGLAASLALALPAPTQTAPPTGVSPHITFELVGPSLLRARLGPTNLGAMLAGEAGRSLWEPRIEEARGAWSEALGGGGDFDRMWARLVDFDGVVRFAVCLDEVGGRDLPTMLAVRVDAGPQADLAGLRADLAHLATAISPDPVRELVVDGTRLEVTALPERIDDLLLSQPAIGDGCVWFVAGTPETLASALQLRAHLDRTPPALLSPRAGAEVLRATFDLQVAPALRTRDLGDAARHALGLDGLVSATMRVGASGPHCTLSLDVQLDGPPRGLIAALAPATTGISGLAAAVPPASLLWTATRLDLGAGYAAALAAIAADGRESVEEIEQEIRAAVGVDPATDLFAHMTDELLVLGSPLRGLDRGRETSWLMAFRLRDDAAFDRGLQTVMGKARAFLSVGDETEVEGVALRRYANMLRYDVWMAVGHGVFVLAAGRDGEELATRLLRDAAAGRLPATTEPAAFADLQRALPPGVQAVTRYDLGELASMPTDWWVELLDMMLPLPDGPRIDDLEEYEHQQQRMVELLRAHRLDAVRTARGSAPQHVHWRLFW